MRRINNKTWVCFECRESVRRPYFRESVICRSCRRECRYLGDKIRIPAKTNSAAWEELRTCLQERSLALSEELQIRRVRVIHNVEKQIAKLRVLPRNAERTKQIAILHEKLAKLKVSNESNITIL